MAKVRLFPDFNEELARKPTSMAEVNRSAVVVDRATLLEMGDSTDVVEFNGTLEDLDAQAAESAANGIFRFLATSKPTGTLFYVNTEGSSYARYAGRVGIRATLEDL